MDAHFVARLAVLAAAFASLGASYRTNNFVVEAPTPAMAQQIGQAAEQFRRDLAITWLGKEMPNWGQPCPITAQVGDHLGAGGATSFVFEHGEVFGWRMTIQGSLVRILDSVLPHEVTHTVFATHFRQPLPRWADEGACTTVEHSSERAKQQTMLIDFLRTDRGIAFNRMFAMREYPHDVMPLYSQGYSVARYLIAQGGKQKFIEYLGDGLRDENWTRATQKFYGVGSLAALQTDWLGWVRQGSPNLNKGQDSTTLVAVSGPASAVRRSRPDANLIYHANSGDLPGPVADNVVQPAVERRAAPDANALAANGRSASQSSDDWKPVRRATAGHGDDASAPAGAEAPPAESNSSEAHQVTRPQPFQRAGQVILEWNRAPGEPASVATNRPISGGE